MDCYFQKFKIQILLGLFIFQKVYGFKSGIYIDNGNDQTIMHRSLTTFEKREMENELLNILGISERPPKLANRTLETAPTLYLKKLLDEFTEKENSGRFVRDAPNINGLSQQDIYTMDSVMTFVDNRDNHISSLRHEKNKRLWFDVSEIPPTETIMSATLRLYKHASTKHPGQTYTISAYVVLDTNLGEYELELVSSVNATSEFDGWLELNMTEPMQLWVNQLRSNQGLYLSIHHAHKGHEIKPHEIGMVNSHGDIDKRPFLVAYFKATPKKNKSRKPRSAGRKRKSDYNQSSYYSRMFDQTQSISRNCQIQTLYVSFKELQWQDWIIAPVGFEAYYCTGECSFPLNAHMNATNHAIVQTLVHLMNPTHVPKPCCAPTKLSSISVLYFRDDSEVTLKKYKNMVVKSCGCH